MVGKTLEELDEFPDMRDVSNWSYRFVLFYFKYITVTGMSRSSSVSDLLILGVKLKSNFKYVAFAYVAFAQSPGYHPNAP